MREEGWVNNCLQRISPLERVSPGDGISDYMEPNRQRKKMYKEKR